MLEHRLNTIKRSSDAQNENWANSIRDAAMTYWHETCTGKMGRDDVSVVDGRLKVYGVENLRIANGSTCPALLPETPWRLA
jgi:choline dehydrogenase